MAVKSKGFNKILLDSIDKALFSLGGSARQSIYFHIENNFKMSKNDIPKNLTHFQSALEAIFGVGSRYLEILIMKNLYSEIGQPLQLEDNCQLEFIKYVDAARQTFVASTCTTQQNL
ncbi:MAG: hypothetical protein NWF00_01480 [Candidatus Bathyarchaeota archaeon]|nr:hypothetical protein [Candidatus Bathyarchaeota archaeon]